MTVASHGIELIRPRSLWKRVSQVETNPLVHRVGQTRETVVHKFVVKDTVEVAIVYFSSSLSLRDGPSRLKQVRETAQVWGLFFAFLLGSSM